jgi:hypothetical protein
LKTAKVRMPKSSILSHHLQFYITPSKPNFALPAEMTEFWIGVRYSPRKGKFITLETKAELEGPVGPTACAYPGFVERDYRPSKKERCLQMLGTAWKAVPCTGLAPARAVCQHGKVSSLTLMRPQFK